MTRVLDNTRPLNEIMEFDCPITVDEFGRITDSDEYAPSVYDDEIDSSGWEFFSHGYTGQYGYNGPMMHNSEYIGGRLERDIRETPGTYVAVVGHHTVKDGHCEFCDAWVEIDGNDAWVDLDGDTACEDSLSGLHYVDTDNADDEEGWAVLRLTD